VLAEERLEITGHTGETPRRSERLAEKDLILNEPEPEK